MTERVDLIDGWNLIGGEGNYTLTALGRDLRWSDSSLETTPPQGENDSHVLKTYVDNQIPIGPGRRLFVNGPGSVIVSDKIEPASTDGTTKFAANQVDTFGHLVTVQPETLFANKQLFDNLPVFWDELLESGAGITSTHLVDKASTIITSTANVAGKFTRQTFMSFDYLAGKTQQVVMTGNLRLSGDNGAGVITRIGQFNDYNGLFFDYDENGLFVVRRSKVTGFVVDDRIPRSAWNVDKLDGTGPSGVVIDPTKSQIFFIDYEWLSVGIVRFGLKYGNSVAFVHLIENQNIRDGAYMSTPNLPIRFQMITTAASPAASMSHICATVASNGGTSTLGISRYDSTEGTSLDVTDAYVIYAVMGIRLKASHIGAVVKLLNATVLIGTNDDFEWVLMLNPVVAGPALVYSDVPDGMVQTAKGVITNLVTGGLKINGGYVKSSSEVSADLDNARYLGAAIDGTLDEFILGVRPLGINAKMMGSIGWRESV